MPAPSKSVVVGGLLAVGIAVNLNAVASAGLVWDDANFGNSVIVAFGTEEPFATSGSASMGAVFASLGSESVSVTAATASGFSASAVVPGTEGGSSRRSSGTSA